MIYGKKLRRASIALISSLAVAASLLTGASPAMAGVDGGNSPGMGSGSYNPNYEVWSVYNQNGAWRDFTSRAVGDQYAGEAALVNQLNSMGPNLADNCKSSRLIVWLHATGSRRGHGSGFLFVGDSNTNVSRVIADWGAQTYYWDGAMANFGTSGQQAIGVFNQTGSPDSRAVNEVRAWAYNGGSYHNGTVIVCAWGGPTDCPNCGNSHTRMTTVSRASDEWTEPYGYTTTVKREITAPEGSNTNDPAGVDIDATGDDPIGVDNLHDEPTRTITTPYAALYDSLAVSSNEELSDLRTRVEATRNTLINGGPSVDLDQNNKDGLREGGVLSVYERTSRATITATQTENWEKCFNNVVRQDFNWTTLTWGPIYTASSGVAACSSRASWTPIAANVPSNANSEFLRGQSWTRTSTNTQAVKNLTTPENTGFYQIISVHCNPEDLAEALAVYGTEGVDYTIISQTVGDTGITTVLNTTKQDRRPSGDSAKLFGVSNDETDYSAADALERTGLLGFYDKECTTNCVNAGGVITNSTIQNGARSNQPLTSSSGTISNYGGALLNGQVNSNFVQLFRDGNLNEITLNTSYPQSTPSLRYDGRAPVSTTVNLWNGSTPDLTPYGGHFILNTTSGTPVFNPNGGAPTTQKNFGTDLYRGSLSSTLPGLHRTFQIGGTWASTVTRPVILNVKWEYQVSNPTTIPTAIGFSNRGDAAALGLETADQLIDVRCYAVYGSTSTAGLALKELTHDYTGTGTENVLDQHLIEGPSTQAGMPSNSNMEQHASENGDTAYSYTTNLVIKFIRAVAG